MKFTFKIVLVYLGFFAFAGNASAQIDGASSAPASAGSAGSSTSSLSNVLRDKKFQENTEITDLKLRAEAGSTSRYSVKTMLIYSGPRVTNLSDPNQPNPDRLVGRHKTTATGAIGARYRLDRDRAISFGTGVAAVAPFTSESASTQRFDVNDPFVTYDITEKVAGIQAHFAPGLSLVTIPEYRRVGEAASFNFTAGTAYDLGLSRWALTLDSRIDYIFYSRSYVRSDKRASQTTIGIYPGMKYKINDRMNVPFSLALGFWNPRSLGNQLALDNKTLSARVGLGWAPRRDVYLYPFLNVYPTALSWASTSVNFQTIFSVL